MTFKELGLAAPLLEALEKEGYENPTPIQAQAIPQLLEGKDLLGSAQTGTGKTAAFTLPILHHLLSKPLRGKRPIRALIVSPTRELAIQIDRSVKSYAAFTNMRHTAIFGGVKQHGQVNKLHKGIDILVATPGRLLDLCNQGFIDLSKIEHFVLDEADQMLDMGFLPDIRRILNLLPKQRQSLFFSATMPSDIIRLSRDILTDPGRVSIAPDQPTAEKVDQLLYFVAKSDKIKLLKHMLEEEKMESVLVFSRTKHGADKVVRLLSKANIRAKAIHGNKSQNQRQQALRDFKDGRIRVLIATDIAARGIDVSGLSHVINYDLPNVAETYVHRIGRTGRAGESGQALSFCMEDELPYLYDIQKLIRQEIPKAEDFPYFDVETAAAAAARQKPEQKRNQRSGRRRSGKKSGGSFKNKSGGGQNGSGQRRNGSRPSTSNKRSRSGSGRPKK